MKIVIIDNYDSFTYNLSHLVKELGAEVDVVRNDQFRLEELEPYSKIILSPGPGIPSEAGLLCDVIRTYAGRKPILGVCLGHQAIGEVFGGKLENLSQVFHGVATPCHILGHPDSNSIVGHASERDVSGSLVGHASERDSASPATLGSVAHYAASGPATLGSVLGRAKRQSRATHYDPMFTGLPADITVGRYHSWVVSKDGFPDCLEVTAVSDEGQIMALRHRDLNVRGIQFHPESVLTPDGKKMLQNWMFL